MNKKVLLIAGAAVALTPAALYAAMLEPIPNAPQELKASDVLVQGVVSANPFQQIHWVWDGYRGWVWVPDEEGGYYQYNRHHHHHHHHHHH